MLENAVSRRGLLLTTGKGVAASLLAVPLMAAAPALEAWASAQWCSDDPLVVLTTPRGAVFPTYLTVDAPVQYQDCLAALRVWTKAEHHKLSDGVTGTQFEVNFHVPKHPVDGAFPIRAYLSSEPFKEGTMYDTALKLTSGKDQHVRRLVNVP